MVATYWPQLATIGTQRAANDEHGHEVATNGYILTRAIPEKVRGAKVGARQKPGKGQSQRVLNFTSKVPQNPKMSSKKGTNSKSTLPVLKVLVPNLVIGHSV